MQKSSWCYQIEDQAFKGFVASPQTANPRPGVLIAHDWSGCSELYHQYAIAIAEQGYVGCALDIYGGGRTGSSVEEKMALMTPLTEDRDYLMRRMCANVAAAAALPQVDPLKMVMIGFCFGGLCALDAARGGADLRGVVSFHGLLQPPVVKQAHRFKPKVLILHGYDDPMVPPQQLDTFAEEMDALAVDWQIHAYGGVKHAFTHPQANDPSLGLRYDAIAQSRAWDSAYRFIAACVD